ncbi:MAG: hypothetical protein GWN47_04330 [Woeseiaceae bacterium]|nr:hypothetical protein [Woeseiaceae bacterium]
MRVLIFLLSAAAATAAHAGDLQSCVGIDSDVARLECYDQLAGLEAAEESAASAAALAPAQPAASAAPEKPAPPAEAMSEQVFGKSVEEAQVAYAEAMGTKEVDEISGTVVSAGKDGFGHVIVELDNGQRWRQARKEYFKLRPGDEVVIKKAALGSYSMQKMSGGRWTKVRRID